MAGRSAHAVGAPLTLPLHLSDVLLERVHPDVLGGYRDGPYDMVVTAQAVRGTLKESEEVMLQLLRNFPSGSVNAFDRDLR